MTTDTYFAETWMALCARFGWKRVAVLSEVGSAELYSTTVRSFYAAAVAAKIDITAVALDQKRATSVADLDTFLRKLTVTHTRVVFYSTSEPLGARLLCRAWKAGLVGRGDGATEEVGGEESGEGGAADAAAGKVIWVTVGWHGKTWFRKGASTPSSPSDCSVVDMDSAAEGFLYTQASTLGVDRSGATGKALPITSTGVLPSAWWEAYAARSKARNRGTHHDGPTVYDAVWTFAYALNELLENKGYSVASLPASHGAGSTPKNLAVLYETMRTLDFQGASGRVKFDQNGDRQGKCMIGWCTSTNVCVPNTSSLIKEAGEGR